MDHRWQLSPQFSNCADASDPLILARLAAAHTPSFLRFYAESSFRYTQASMVAAATTPTAADGLVAFISALITAVGAVWVYVAHLAR
jgi:hypothetical protein